MSTCNIIIADDHPILREGVRLLIETNAHWKVIGEANDGVELMDILKKVTPNIVVVDLAMPRMQGLAAIRECRRCYPGVKTVVLSGFLTDDYVSRALSAGASGIVNKAGLGKELMTAIDRVHNGGEYLSPDLEDTNSSWTSGGPDSPLTHRETEIVSLIAQGHTSKEIGPLIDVSPRTVDKHRSNIMEKLKLRNVIELVRYAIRNGLASLV